jgi:hypothetical protein
VPATKSDIKSHLKQQTDAAWNKFASERAIKQQKDEERAAREAFKAKAIKKAAKHFTKLLAKAKLCKDFPASNYSVLDVVSCALGGKRAVVSATGTILMGSQVIGTATRTPLGVIETLECHNKWYTWIAYRCAPTKELHFSIVGMVRLTPDNCPGFPSRIA